MLVLARGSPSIEDLDVFVYADDIVTVVYTAAYLEAVPVMRVYALGMVLLTVEVGSLLLLMRQGPYAIAVNGLALALSAAASLAQKMCVRL